MKKIFNLFLILFLFIGIVVPGASAGLIPYAISGHVINGGPLVGVSITIKNLDEGITLITTTDSGGYFLATISDWGNGDRLEVTACDVQVNPLCKQTKVIGDTCPVGGGCEFEFQVTTAQIKECPDGSLILIDATCPEPEPEPPKIDSNDAETIASFDVAYGQEFTIEVSNNKLGNLLDEDIEVDGEDYAVSENILFNGIIKTSIDDVDYIEPVLTVPDKGIRYTYLFEEPVPTSEFDFEDPLEIVFAGVPTRIIEATDDRLVIQKGTEKTVKLNECSGDVCVILISEGKARIEVNGIEDTINEGKTQTINGIEINVLEVWSDDNPAVTLMFSDDVRRSIDRGDGYIE